MNKITIKEKHCIEVKRFHVPHIINTKCPNCGNEVKFLDDYLSYPTLNSEESVYSYCDNCEYEMELPIKIGMTLEYDLNNIKKL